MTSLQDVLAALPGLDDDQLQAVIARTQTILLDRPAPAGAAPALSVEIVGRTERRVLAAYRALRQPGVLRGVRRVLVMRKPRRVAGSPHRLAPGT